MSDLQEPPTEGAETVEVVEPPPAAVPIVAVPVRRREWNEDGVMELPADAASHWDVSAWHRC